MTASISKLALGSLLGFQLIVFEWAVLARGRLGGAPGGPWPVALLGLLVYGGAIAFVLEKRRARVAGAVSFIAAILLTARLYVPAVVFKRRHPDDSPTTLIAFLRDLSAAQEQYRLINGVYAQSVDSLHRWATPPAGASVRLDRHGNAGWSARATLGKAECAVWARDSTLSTASWLREGLPTCGKENPKAEYASRTVLVDAAAERGFTDADISGEWLQHRVEPSRAGVTALSRAPLGARWTYALGGELRASAAVAGNQVFVGAHGNGEFVALTLDSGRLGYRLRVPNWVHHEPVVTSDLVIVSFGNSEPISEGGPQHGSPPSGIVAFDRRNGTERWRRNTHTSVMTSPVVYDSLVAVVTNEGDAIAWRITDGLKLWRTRLNEQTPMGNPLLADTVLFVGLELSELCALDVRSGRTIYCNKFASDGWGAGHSSPTLAGKSILMTYHTRSRWFWLKAILGISEPTNHGDAVLVSLDASTGHEQWRRSLGRGIHDVVGHIAGTPVVVGKTAYVAEPTSGRVVALRTDSGHVIWSVDVSPARGSVLVTHGAVLIATINNEVVILEAETGSVRCRMKLPGRPDRAAITVAGETGILTLRSGTVLARPIGDWLACRAQD